MPSASAPRLLACLRLRLRFGFAGCSKPSHKLGALALSVLLLTAAAPSTPASLSRSCVNAFQRELLGMKEESVPSSP